MKFSENVLHTYIYISQKFQLKQITNVVITVIVIMVNAIILRYLGLLYSQNDNDNGTKY